ncbi:MAG: helix-turn-helix domain-containing protein [Myxococcota bacterium]
MTAGDTRPPPDEGFDQPGAPQALYSGFRLAMFSGDHALCAAYIDRCRAAAIHHPELDLIALLTDCARAVFEGRQSPHNLDMVIDRCRQQGHGELLLDAQTLVVLLRTFEDLPPIREARRLARMSESEGFVDREAIAALCLARTRRLEGRPWLAQRIMAIAVVPAGLAPLKQCEGEMVGDVGHALHQALTNADPRAELQTWAAQRQHTLWRRDATIVQQIYGLADTVDPVVDAWRRGDVHQTPRGFRDPATLDKRFMILLRPGRSAIRIAPASLFDPALKTARDTTINLTPKLSMSLAAIAFTGQEGLSKSQWTTMVRGTDQPQSEVASLTRVIRHRIRRALPEGLTLESDAVHLRLRVERPALMDDPLGTVTLEERILAYLAWCPNEGTQGISEAVGAPLRTVQTALAALVESGVCRQVRDQRQIHYRIDDTGFRTQTQARVNIAWM